MKAKEFIEREFNREVAPQETIRSVDTMSERYSLGMSQFMKLHLVLNDYPSERSSHSQNA